MTDCELCRQFEAPPPTRASVARDMLMAGLARLSRPSPASQMISHMGMVMALTMGSAMQEPSWYEKHRKAWVETGELIELDRMLRHPLPPPPVPSPRAHARQSSKWLPPVIAVPVGAILAAVFIAVCVWLINLTGWLW